jgi:repressor LexA
MTSLTARQQSIYDFIVLQVRRNGIPPTLMEIAHAFGLTSAAGVSDHLKAIERKGFIRRRPGASRGIEVQELRRSPKAESATRVPVRGSVPARSRPSTVEPTRSIALDGRLAKAGHLALRAKTRKLERRGILEGDMLVIEPGGQTEPGDLVVGLQERGTCLLEISERGRSARPVAGRVDPADDVELIGRVVAVIRSLRGLR